MATSFDDALVEAAAVVERIWARDDTVWPDGGTAGAGQSGQDRFAWLDAAEAPARDRSRWTTFADALVDDGVTDVVVIGTGGAVAATRVLVSLVSEPRLRLHVLDTVHGDAVHHVRERLVPATWAVVASIAPGDVVTSSLLARFRADLVEGLGAEPGLGPTRAASRIVVIDHKGGDGGGDGAGTGQDDGLGHGLGVAGDTDPDRGTALGDGGGAALEPADLTVSEPVSLDGPFGALSTPGRLSAALLGLDGRAHLAGLADVVATTRSPDLDVNEAARLGAFLAAAVNAHRDQLTVVPDAATTGFVEWVEHLVAAATGKSGVGLVPIVDEPLLEPIAYGPSRFVVAIGIHHGIRSVAEAGIPVVTLDEFGVDGLAVEWFRWQFATAVACALIGVDPFAVPEVMTWRRLTRKVLDGGGRRLAIQPMDDLLDELEDADWLALLGFVDPNAMAAHQLRRVTATLRRRYGIPVRLEFAPACLSTTGQLHKAGPPEGVFAVVLEPASTRIPVPGAGEDLEDILEASAAGDVAALRDAGRVVVVVDLDELLAA